MIIAPNNKNWPSIPDIYSVQNLEQAKGVLLAMKSLLDQIRANWPAPQQFTQGADSIHIDSYNVAKLRGDSNAPGALKMYATDHHGIRRWLPQPIVPTSASQSPRDHSFHWRGQLGSSGGDITPGKCFILGDEVTITNLPLNLGFDVDGPMWYWVTVDTTANTATWKSGVTLDAGSDTKAIFPIFYVMRANSLIVTCTEHQTSDIVVTTSQPPAGKDVDHPFKFTNSAPTGGLITDGKLFFNGKNVAIIGLPLAIIPSFNTKYWVIYDMDAGTATWYEGPSAAGFPVGTDTTEVFPILDVTMVGNAPGVVDSWEQYQWQDIIMRIPKGENSVVFDVTTGMYQLVNDVLAPGPNQYYGTDASNPPVKTFHALPGTMPNGGDVDHPFKFTLTNPAGGSITNGQLFYNGISVVITNLPAAITPVMNTKYWIVFDFGYLTANWVSGASAAGFPEGSTTQEVFPILDVTMVGNAAGQVDHWEQYEWQDIIVRVPDLTQVTVLTNLRWDDTLHEIIASQRTVKVVDPGAEVDGPIITAAECDST